MERLPRPAGAQWWAEAVCEMLHIMERALDRSVFGGDEAVEDPLVAVHGLSETRAIGERRDREAPSLESRNRCGARQAEYC